jgi:hypothetical protein
MPGNPMKRTKNHFFTLTPMQSEKTVSDATLQTLLGTTPPLAPLEAEAMAKVLAEIVRDLREEEEKDEDLPPLEDEPNVNVNLEIVEELPLPSESKEANATLLQRIQNLQAIIQNPKAVDLKVDTVLANAVTYYCEQCGEKVDPDDCYKVPVSIHKCDNACKSECAEKKVLTTSRWAVFCSIKCVELYQVDEEAYYTYLGEQYEGEAETDDEEEEYEGRDPEDDDYDY